MYHYQKKTPLFQECQNTGKKIDMKLSAKIKDLKRNLMSRNRNHQKLAIRTIHKQLKNKKSQEVANVLLITDVPGLLCDVLNNHNISLIKDIFSCLLELSKYEMFYEQNHSDIVIDTSCRTLKILMKKSPAMITIYLGIKLLSQILTRCHTRMTVNMVQVFLFTEDVFSNPLLQPVHLNAMVLLRLILKDKEFNHKNLTPVVYKALRLLWELNKNNKKKFNRHLCLATEIMLLSLRLCCMDKFNAVSLKTSDLILHIIKTSVITFIQNLEVKKCHAGFVKRLLNCIVSAYFCLDGDTISSLSIKMASLGFLSLLPAINLHYQDKALHSLIMTLLSHILVKLAISEMGLLSRDSQLVTSGLHYLPPDVSKWPKLLAQPQEHEVYPSIIVYFYFFFLCSDRLKHTKSSIILSECSSHLSAFCHFLLSHHSPIHPALVKGIWLCFAILTLSLPATQQDNKKYIQTASRVLVNWVRATSLPSVYTHHPALLLWSFSPFCPKKTLQMDLVMLWMKDTREPSINQMESLALINKDTTLCLLDVLNCGSEAITCRVMTILKKVGNRENHHRSIDMGISIWDNLARTLSVLFTPQPEAKVQNRDHLEHLFDGVIPYIQKHGSDYHMILKVHNVACVVNLACKLVPTTDTSTLLRVSNQLLRTFHIANIDSDKAQTLHSQLYKLAHVLLLKMNQVKNNPVLETFIQNVNFIRALLSSLDCSNQLVLLPALKLLTFLQYQQRLHSIQVIAPQRVKGETMLRLVADSSTKLASLDLISQLFTASRIHPILDLPTVLPGHFIESLYLEFQNLILKTSIGWRCQTLLLQYCQTHSSNMELRLLTQYLNYQTLELDLAKNGLKNAMLQEYLQVWLAGIVRYRRMLIRIDYSKALCQDLISMILTLLARSLVQQEDLPGTLANIASKICNIGGNIPKKVIQSLKTKIQSEFGH